MALTHHTSLLRVTGPAARRQEWAKSAAQQAVPPTRVCVLPSLKGGFVTLLQKVASHLTGSHRTHQANLKCALQVPCALQDASCRTQASRCMTTCTRFIIKHCMCDVLELLCTKRCFLTHRMTLTDVHSQKITPPTLGFFFFSFFLFFFFLLQIHPTCCKEGPHAPRAHIAAVLRQRHAIVTDRTDRPPFG